jgi:hypothetical protein
MIAAPSIPLDEIEEISLEGPKPVCQPFAAPKIKIERARTVLAELSRAIDTFLNTNPATVRVEIREPKSNRPQAFFHWDARGAPEMIGAIIGDIIHNLRSALDLTACELARAASESDKGVYFPFCDRPDALEKAIKDKRFHKAGPEAVALLRQLQPYREGNAALRAIHDLDIQDKHQMLIPAFMTIASPILSRWDDDGTPNLTVVGDPNLPSEIHLIFPQGPLAGAEILPTLEHLTELMSGIVEAFCALVNR